MSEFRNFLKGFILSSIFIFGFMMGIVLIFNFLSRYTVVMTIIGYVFISGIILSFYIYFSRLIRWDLNKHDLKKTTSQNKLEYLRSRHFMLGITYRNWLNSAGSSALFEFVFTGAIAALVIGLFIDAWEKTQSWREMLTIDYLYLYVVAGAFIGGCVIAIGSWLSMDRQFKRRLERFELTAQEELQRMQENSD